MEFHRFIEKHSKGSKSSFDEAEAFASYQYHQKFQAFLISPLVLRSIHCGQIDICCLDEGEVLLVEVKRSQKSLTRAQKQRLLKSLDFICRVVDCPGRILLINPLPNI